MIISQNQPAEEPAAMPAVVALAWQHRYKLLLPAVAGLAAGLVGYSSADPTFRSETVLVLDARRIQALSTDAVVSPLPQESPALRSELDIIGSTSMARTVLRRLEAEGVDVTVPTGDGAGGTSADSVERAKAARLISGLSVTNDGRSYTIYIDFTDRDPQFSARVADAFAAEYIDHQTESQRNETRRVADWLGGKLGSLRQRLQDSEKAAEDFRHRAGLTQANGTTLQAQRVTSLQQALMNAGADVAGAQARLDTARQLQKSGDLPALAEVLASPSIQALRTQIAEAERKLSVIRASGASKSDQIPLLTHDIEAGKVQIAAEVENVVDSLQSEISVAQEKYSRISEGLQQAQKSLGDASMDQLKLDQLEREAGANRAVYEGYLQRYKQAIEQEGIVTPEARIISAAASNTWKVGPRLANWLALGLAGGLALGLLAAFASQIVERRFRSPRHISRVSGLPLLGSLPRLSRRKMLAETAAGFDARSAYGRSISAVNATLKPGSGDRSGRVFAVVSPRKAEGRTSIVVAMARALAASGHRVVAIDTHLYRPGLAKRFGTRPTAFLNDLADSAKGQLQLLCKDPASSACIIAARKSAGPSEAVVASGQFAALLADLRKRFDFILLDTEALEVSSAALHAAVAGDEVIMIALPDTPLDQIVAAVEQTTECRRRPLGIVVNRSSGQTAREMPEILHRAADIAAPATMRAAE